MALGERLAPHIPYLRRYARALTGTQASGDHYVRTTLEAIIADQAAFAASGNIRVELYKYFQGIWNSTGEHRGDMLSGDDGTDDIAVATRRLQAVTPLRRQMLLLSSMEGFSADDIAIITALDSEAVSDQISQAMAELHQQTRTRVLIIEDEPIIAMDIESLVEGLGHEVVGISVTRDEAVAMARATQPGLILADIQLADDSSGIDAVADILEDFTVPVIFITAFPERLLTGDRPEPAFLITKPFQERTVMTAIAQALFFNPTTAPD